MRPLAPLLCLLACCCAEQLPYRIPSGPVPAHVRQLASGWATLSPAAFEALVERDFPLPAGATLDEAALDELGGALGGPIEIAVRAAVLLGRSRTDAAAQVLLAHLETRLAYAERNADAAAVVAANALARFPEAAPYAERLETLGSGPDAHPDLEVRVECACSALALGRTSVVPFLLRVLRIGTPAGDADARDFEVSPTTAWARGQAATALSQQAGVPVAYRTDAPLTERERAAAELEAVLASPSYDPSMR